MFFEIFRKRYFILLLSALIWILVGCNTDQIDKPDGATETVSLIPYVTPTASQTPEVRQTDQVLPTQQPSPTPTPMVYTIVEGDTMLAIAFQHGISLEELQAANPEVNARLLVVGTELIIPIGDVIPSNPVTATPIPVEIAKTNCYPAPDGVWCFVTITNERNRPLENLSAQVVLQDNSGAFIAEGTAFGMINLIPVDEELPLAVFIPGRFPSEITGEADVITVQTLPRNDERYLNGWIEVEDVDISENGDRAQVSGSIGLPAKSNPGNLVWIMFIAYDADGNVVGVRKIEQSGVFEPGSSRGFTSEVYSLGAAIDSVRAFVEVRP